MNTAANKRSVRYGINRNRGVIAMLTLIFLGMLILILGIATASAGQTQLITAGDVDYERTMEQMTDTCVDEAIVRLKTYPYSNYTGLILVNNGDSCYVTTTGSGTTRTMAVNGCAGLTTCCATLSSCPGYSYAEAVNVTLTQKQNAAANAVGWDITNWRQVSP